MTSPWNSFHLFINQVDCFNIVIKYTCIQKLIWKYFFIVVHTSNMSRVHAENSCFKHEIIQNDKKLSDDSKHVMFFDAIHVHESSALLHMSSSATTVLSSFT